MSSEYTDEQHEKNRALCQALAANAEAGGFNTGRHDLNEAAGMALPLALDEIERFRAPFEICEECASVIIEHDAEADCVFVASGEYADPALWKVREGRSYSDDTIDISTHEPSTYKEAPDGSVIVIAGRPKYASYDEYMDAVEEATGLSRKVLMELAPVISGSQQ